MLAGLVSDRVVRDGGPVPVIVLLPRCAELPILLLAILKAGGVYVPIDTDFPLERVDRMVGECGGDIVITDRSGSALVNRGHDGPTIIYLDDLEDLRAEEAPSISRTPDDECAILFTSGSTGVPKGIRMYERGLNNAAWSTITEVRKFDEEIRCLLFASPSFDASLITMLIPLLSGGTVVIADRETIESKERFLAMMEQGRVTFAIFPPTFLATLDHADFPSLRVIGTAGEPPVISDVRYYAGRIPYLNAYGPAESSICASIHAVDPSEDVSSDVPIGREIPNTVALIVDRYGNILPEGIDGELWIGGVGVGPGYLDTANTELAFVDHPSLPNIRFYRTGDIVRRGFDGLLHFRGRRDTQVKIRGHRVEPGEVTHVLAGHEDLSGAAVVSSADDRGNTILNAWVVPASGRMVDLIEVRNWLAARLPSYMVPSRFFMTDDLPLGPTGKVDDGRLREMADAERASTTSGDRPRSPSSEEERILCEGVAAVLGIESVSPEDNYFMLGGDSIRAIELTWRLRSAGYRIEVRDLFTYPLLADAVRMMRPERAPDQESRVFGPVPLHPIQHWFFDAAPETCAHYFNQSILLRWSREKLDTDRLRIALEQIVEQHDMLRAYFLVDTPASDPTDGRRPAVPTQTIAETMPVDLKVIEIEQDEGEDNRFHEELLATHRDLPLESGPLFRTRVIRRHEGDRVAEYVHVVAHHLVIDIVSWHVLIDDLIQLYGTDHASSSGTSGAASRSVGSSYRSWVEAMQRYVEGDRGSTLVDYWNVIGSRMENASMLSVDDAGSRRTGVTQCAFNASSSVGVE